MIKMPNKYAKSFKNLNYGIENSSTITSEHEMYKKDPAAKQENITSTKSL